MSVVQNALDKLKDREQAQLADIRLEQPASAAVASDVLVVQRSARPVEWVAAAYPTVDLSRASSRSRSPLIDDRELARQREDYRNLRREVLVAMRSTRRSTGRVVGPVIVVTSAHPGDGKSYTALNLALSMASDDSRDVLLIDGDTARASLTEACDLTDCIGLVELLRSPNADFRGFVAASSMSRMRIMPAGRRDRATADLITTGRVADLFEKLNNVFAGHAVVVDTPPVLASSEAQSLIDAAGQVLLVVRAGMTTPDAVRDAVGRIAEDVPVGVVLNAWEPISPSERKAYQHYGDYGTSD